MSAGSGLLDAVGFREYGTVGAFTETSLVGEDVSVEVNDDEMPTISGPAFIGIRRTINIPFLLPSTFATLDNMQAARKQVELQLKYADGAVYTYGPAMITAVPLLSPVPDLSKLYIAEHGTSGDPPGADFEDLGNVADPSTPDFNPEVKQDGANRQLFCAASMRQTVELQNDVADEINAYEGQKVVLAFEHPDGSFRKLKNVYVRATQNPQVGVTTLRTVRMDIWGRAAKFGDLIVYPSVPRNYFYGCRLTATVFGYQESDFLTVS